MLHHHGCYGVPHLSEVVRQIGSLDTHSWQVILMSSISPIMPVINNSISAQPTQTDKCTHKSAETHKLTHGGLQGINEKGNGYISGRLTCFSYQAGVCPHPLLSAVHCLLQAGHFKLYHLLSLAHCRMRIWKAVTKFIWDEWEQIAWSRCYKGDKTKATPLWSSVCVCVPVISLCVFECERAFFLVFKICSPHCYGKWITTEEYPKKHNLGEHRRIGHVCTWRLQKDVVLSKYYFTSK